MNSHLTLYHCPQSRSTGVLNLLVALHAPYDLQVMNMKLAEQRQQPYLAINPMGKVPAIRHGEAVITEQVAIYLYLADLYAEAGLAPPIGDPLRGPYLRWMAFYGSCFEPAVIDAWMKREPVQKQACGYGDHETVLTTVIGQLSNGPYLLGERFSAADVLWGSSLSWMNAFGLLPDTPVIAAYIERFQKLPATIAANEKDGALAAAQAA